MLLAIDAGNTNIVLGLIDNDEIISTFRVSTDRNKTKDEYLAVFSQILSAYKVDISKIDGVVVCSVVPPVTESLIYSSRVITGIDPVVVSYMLDTGLDIVVDTPDKLGADLIADGAAAAAQYPLPAIVFDLGTANTISVIDEGAKYLGGVIMPGLKLQLNSLSANTAQLPNVSIAVPDSCIGKNTIDCIRSGNIFGTAAMMDGMIDRMEDALGKKATVIATGGLSTFVVPNCMREGIIYDENLLLKGMKIIHDRNK